MCDHHHGAHNALWPVLAVSVSVPNSKRCCNAKRRLVACDKVNDASEAKCTACGAARWDGEQGQLRARVAAILQVRIFSRGTVSLSTCKPSHLDTTANVQARPLDHISQVSSADAR